MRKPQSLMRNGESIGECYIKGDKKLHTREFCLEYDSGTDFKYLPPHKVQNWINRAMRWINEE